LITQAGEHALTYREEAMHGVYLFGPRDLRLIEQEPDTLGPDEVRIEVAVSGICGTELHLYTGMIFGSAATKPAAMGHEYTGRVVEVGSRVTTVAVGDRVTSIPGGPCSRCLLCRTGRPSMCPHRVSGRRGSWAPSLVVPAELCWRLPDEVPDDLGTLAEPLACAVRAVDRAGLRNADRVCVIGAGPIGLLIMKVARASGACSVVVSEPSPYRRAMAQAMGADVVVDPRERDLIEVVQQATDGLGADVVFEAVGLPATIEQAIAAAAPGGTIVIAGVADKAASAIFYPQEIFFKELTIRGTKGVTHGVDRAIRWLGRLDLAPLITHTFPLANYQPAVDLALAGQAGKVLLRP
jgi:2-desacetyl-2-hydroxyethyl bacteriochlorophyllide A dehydrogenase